MGDYTRDHIGLGTRFRVLAPQRGSIWVTILSPHNGESNGKEEIENEMETAMSRAL